MNRGGSTPTTALGTQTPGASRRYAMTESNRPYGLDGPDPFPAQLPVDTPLAVRSAAGVGDVTWWVWLSIVHRCPLAAGACETRHAVNT